MTRRPTATAVVATALGAAASGLAPFVLSVSAWPEIVTPAWFVTRGVPLYEGIFFPHTPLLILLTALAGGLFGFNAPLLRCLVALPMAAAGALLVVGTRPGHRSGARFGLFLGVPLFVLWTVYTEGPALWPEPALAPLILGATLLLERFEKTGSRRALGAGALLLGTAVLVKQTSAWAGLAALAWLLLRSSRRSWPAVLLLSSGVAAPYAVFAAGWGLLGRTTAHLTWTLVLPLLSQHAPEIATRPDAADLHEALALFLAIPALGLALRALPGSRLRSPAAFLVAGCAGMAWPRWGLLHLSAAVGVVSLLLARAAPALLTAARRGRRRSLRSGGRLAFAAGAGAFLTGAAVAVAGAGPLLLDRIGGPLFHWDDRATSVLAASVRRRVPPGGELFVFDAPQNLYPLTGTRFPGGLYVNPSFWYYLNKEGLDGRLVAILAARPGLPILFHEPWASETALRRTELWRFLSTRTRVAERLDGSTSWRVVAPPGG